MGMMNIKENKLFNGIHADHAVLVAKNIRRRCKRRSENCEGDNVDLMVYKIKTLRMYPNRRR